MLDSNFYLVFAAWFNVDDIDLSNMKRVDDRARTTAVDLINKGFDPAMLISELTDILEKWEPGTIMKFINASDVDWLFNSETEQILKDIIKIMIDELKAHSGKP